MMTRYSNIISVARGIVISGALVILLPITAGADFIWWAMPITEASVFLYALCVFLHPSHVAQRIDTDRK